MILTNRNKFGRKYVGLTNGMANLIRGFVYVLLALFCGVFFESCSDSEVTAGEFRTIENAQWRYGQVVRFNQKGDTLPGEVHTIDVSVRHTNEYPYANLWMEMRYHSQDSLIVDTFNIFLSDEYGKWKGSGSGPVKLFTDTFQPSAVPDDGTEFALRHIMRVDVLPDIEQIGLSYHTVSCYRRALDSAAETETPQNDD